MSGISVAVTRPVEMLSSEEKAALPAVRRSYYSKISFVQLQLLAYTLVFAVSGLVPLEDLLTAFVVTVYSIALSLLVFPTKGTEVPANLFSFHRWYPLYVALGSVIGLVLPLAYILGGFAKGDQSSVRQAIPPLFLLSFQLLTENVIMHLPWMSLPVRALVPLIYTARRVLTLLAWVRYLFESEEMRRIPLSDPWAAFGRGLAITNLGFWSANLSLFIIPMFLPRAFEKHFELMRNLKEEGPGIVEESVESEDQHVRTAELRKVDEDDFSAVKNKVI